MSHAFASPRTMIPVARPYIGRDEEQRVLDVLRSGWVTQGPCVAEFESQFSAKVGCNYAVAVSSCTTALHLALIVCGIGHGDEVICPSLSFIATANSISSTGAVPVFADIELATYNIDPDHVEALITPRTRAIMVVHQIGLPADMKRIMSIAAKHGLLVIEDAACAIGAEYEGEWIGKPIGDLACFSFHPRKIMTTGEGGMITTNNAGLAERMRRLRQHAMSLSDVARHNSKMIVTETYSEVGFNYRMTDMQAALGIAQLDHLDSLLERRRTLANRYTEAFSEYAWLVPPHVPANSRHNFQSYMVRLVGDIAPRRDEIMQALLEKSISTRRGIMAIHREPPYSTEHLPDLLPLTCTAADTAIILPLFHQMTEVDQEYIIDTLREVVTSMLSRASGEETLTLTCKA